jgi:uncharacterized protein YjiS (DUF1127 family)
MTTSSRLRSLDATGLTSAFSRPLSAIRRHIKHRATRRTLMDLDDHLLRDIGLTRGNIEDAMRRVGHHRP